MNSIVFRKGVKDWEMTYTVEIGFAYTADLEKELTDVILHQVDNNQKISIPWSIFKPYLVIGGSSIYADASGLVIKPVEGGVLVSDSRFLNILIQKDQMEAIKRTAKNIKEDVSKSIEKILKDFSSRRASA